MKKNLYTAIFSIFLPCLPLTFHAAVKTFVNNSKKNLIVRVHGNNHDVTAIKLPSGAIQEVFTPSNLLEKIVLHTEVENKNFNSMNRQILSKETHALNEHMVFIIHQNGSVKMYKACTSRDYALEKIDKIFMEHQKLPSLDMTIHMTKTDQPWVFQNINYDTKYSKGFLEQIGSIFS